MKAHYLTYAREIYPLRKSTRYFANEDGSCLIWRYVFGFDRERETHG